VRAHGVRHGRVPRREQRGVVDEPGKQGRYAARAGWAEFCCA
jgi:hypothetical protein